MTEEPTVADPDAYDEVWESMFEVLPAMRALEVLARTDDLTEAQRHELEGHCELAGLLRGQLDEIGPVPEDAPPQRRETRDVCDRVVAELEGLATAVRYWLT